MEKEFGVPDKDNIDHSYGAILSEEPMSEEEWERQYCS